MKKALCLIAVAAFVATATAGSGINLFVSQDEALTANQFNKEQIDFRADFTGANTPAMLPVDMTENCGTEQVFYVWGQWNDPFGDFGQAINGIHILAQANGGMTIVDSVMYRQEGISQGKAGDATKYLRWNTDQHLELHTGNGGIGVAVTSNGIELTYDALDWDISQGTGSPDYVYTFLIGAVKVQCDCNADGELYVGVGTLGVSFGSDGFQPVQLDGVAIDNPPSEIQWALTAFCTPEPASILLIGLAGLFLRRR